MKTTLSLRKTKQEELKLKKSRRGENWRDQKKTKKLKGGFFLVWWCKATVKERGAGGGTKSSTPYGGGARIKEER